MVRSTTRKFILLIVSALFLFAFTSGGYCQNESPYKDLLKSITCDDYKDADIVTVFDSTHVVVEESGLSHLNIHTLTKILTVDGAKSQSGHRFDYDPASNMVEIKKVAVHKKDGTMQEVDLSKLIDRPQPQRMIYWGPRMKVIGIEDLRVGDAVEIQYYTKGFMIAYLTETMEDESRYIPPMRGHYYDTILFGTGHPVKHKVYVLKTIKDRPVQFKVYNGDIQTTALAGLDGSDGFTYIFEKKDIPVYPHEYSAPGASDYIPKVVLATVKDWYEKAKWFHDVNENSEVEIYGMKVKPFEYDDELKNFVQKLIAPYKTEYDQRKVINHWVAQHIRYSGISMGKGEGYTLHPGIMTFRDRAGVCKDIAGMSVTMFRAAGFKSYPTMTMAGSCVEQIPADQFNHCVVAVDISGEPNFKTENLKGRKGFEKYEMYDPTWVPNSMDIWSRYEGDQNIVIGSPTGEDLTAIRPYEPWEVRMNIRSKAAIDKDGNLTGTLEFDGLGSSDSRLRRLIANTGTREEISNSIAGYLANIAPGAELVSYEHGDLFDYWNPMTLKINYRIPGYALNYGEGLHFNSPAAKFLVGANFIRPIFRYAQEEKRETPLFLYAPQNFVIDEEIVLPRGYKRLTDVKPSEAGGDFANFKASVSNDKKGLKINYEYVVSERFVEVDEYPQVWEITESMKKFADINIHMWRN